MRTTTSTVTRRSRRPRHFRRRPSLAAMKEALADGRVHATIGLVTAEGVDQHYEYDGEDLLIEVETADGDFASARWALGGGGQGLFWVPDPGTEVALNIVNGDLEAGVFIVGVLSSGATAGTLNPGTVVLAGENIRLVTGDASEPVVLGNQLFTLLQKLYQLIIAHNHQGLIATTPPLNAVDLTAELAKLQLKNWHSTKVKVA